MAEHQHYNYKPDKKVRIFNVSRNSTNINK